MITLQSHLSRPIPGSPRGRALVWVLAIAYVINALVDLTAEALSRDDVARITQGLAMPLLAAVLIVATRRLDRLITLVLVALIFSWLGDAFAGDVLLLKIVFFLLAQLAFIVAFWPHRSRSLLRRPSALIGYGVLALALLSILLPRTGALVVPVLIYGLSLVLMAVLASGLGRRGAIGGLFFVISDSMLGVKWFHQPQAAVDLIDFAIMFSYLLAQALLVFAVIAVTNRRSG
jgi:uncharacterized membrane protein YhhN